MNISLLSLDINEKITTWICDNSSENFTKTSLFHTSYRINHELSSFSSFWVHWKAVMIIRAHYMRLQGLGIFRLEREGCAKCMIPFAVSLQKGILWKIWIQILLRDSQLGDEREDTLLESKLPLRISEQKEFTTRHDALQQGLREAMMFSSLQIFRSLLDSMRETWSNKVSPALSRALDLIFLKVPFC